MALLNGMGRRLRARCGQACIYVALLLVLGFLVPFTQAFAADDSSPKRVLLLNSYNQSMNWVRNIVRAVEDTLQPQANNIELYIENLDAKVFHTPEHFARMYDLLDHKYKSKSFDLVMSSDNHAFEFMKTHRQALFGSAPLVFCGINNFQPDMLKGLNQVTGVAETISARETVDLILANHPQLERLYIINDFLLTGQQWQSDLRRDLAGLPADLDVVYAAHLSLSELQAAIGLLPENSAVLLGVFFSDSQGVHSTYEDMGAQLSKACPVPFYCLLEFNLRAGAIGGRLISGYHQGAAMAQLGRRVLAGEDPANLPIVSGQANRYVFDYAGLERWDLDVDDLPAGSLILNRPLSLWQAYRTEVVSGAILVVGLVGVILALSAAIGRRRRAEAHLREHQEKLAITLDSIGDAVITTRASGEISSLNKMAVRLTGWTEADAVGKSLQEILPLHDRTTHDLLPDLVQDVLAAGQVVNKADAMLLVRPDGTERLVADSGAPIKRNDGSVDGVVLVLRDITEQVELEERLRHSQKMESVGQLAGGVAHDFNNMLAGIIGYADMLKDEVVDRPELVPYVANILKAGQRAATLVQKLLSFSRKGEATMTSVDVHANIEEVVALLHGSLDRGLAVDIDLVADDHTVHADATQIQQLILNLAINARDAMVGGGILGIRSCNVFLDRAFCELSMFPVEPGEYLEVAVSDTGCGMSDDVLENAFEPFFTTKPIGEGTGLGLAVVHGTVQKHKGTLLVDSEVGRGTTFRVFLPLAQVSAVIEPTAEPIPARGSGGILVVDDEPLIRNLVRHQLESLGYRVLLAADGAEGLELYAKHQQDISLVLLDRVMPRLNGRDCFRAIRKIDPQACIVIASGYEADKSVDEMFDEGLVSFIKKPYRLSELGALLSQVLKNRQHAGD